jgi:hypothetical protein
MKWTEKPSSIILLIILFFPLGIYLMWKNDVFSKRNRVIVTSVFGIIFLSILGGSESNSTDNEILLNELTNGNFIDGPQFNNDFTFYWDVNEDLRISGKYKIGKFFSYENTEGYKGMRHLGWTINFSEVGGASYWDKDNTMNLSYDWNHPKAKTKLILKGESSYYPMNFEKSVDGKKLVEKYWSK